MDCASNEMSDAVPKCRVGLAVRVLSPTHHLLHFLLYFAMSATDVAYEIRSKLPRTEDIIVDYLSGYLVDEASEDEDVLQITRNMLESFARDRPSALEELLQKLAQILETRLQGRAATRAPKLTKLDKVMDMSKSGGLSNTITFGGAVDLESVNKAKYAHFNLFISFINYENGIERPESMSRSWRNKKRSSRFFIRLVFPGRSIHKIFYNTHRPRSRNAL